MARDNDLTVSEMATLGQLFDQHRSRLLAMLRRRIDPALAVRVDPEEILSESFLEARRKWRQFSNQGKLTPYAWLYRIALDCLIEVWRREARSKRDIRREIPWPEHSSVQLGLSMVAPGTSPSEAVAREDMRALVRQVMGCLSDRDQEILWMRHFDHLSFPEAAMILDITQNAATVRYARALQRLRDLWFEKGYGHD